MTDFSHRETMRQSIETVLAPRLVAVAQKSGCRKSPRAVLVVRPDGEVVGEGSNSQPSPFACDGSDVCRANCARLCVHAEAAALLTAGPRARGAHLIHSKVINGVLVPSQRGPTCEKCSPLVLFVGIETVWLLMSRGWTPWSAQAFHRETLEHHQLPVLLSASPAKVLGDEFDVARWLEDLYQRAPAQLEASSPEAGAAQVHVADTVDRLLSTGRRDKVQALMDNIDSARTAPRALLTLLGVAAKAGCPGFERFRSRVAEVLSARSEDLLLGSTGEDGRHGR